MTKIGIIKLLLEKGEALSLYDLLRGASAHNRERHAADKDPLPPIDLTKIVGAVRDHLYFVSKFGDGKTHVIDNGRHYFAYPEKFDEWLRIDAPGIHFDDLERLYESLLPKWN